jgi:hypothetical protein
MLARDLRVSVELISKHSGDADSLAEEWAAFRWWVEQGLERSGRRSGQGCACEECQLRRERGALISPGAE